MRRSVFAVTLLPLLGLGAPLYGQQDPCATLATEVRNSITHLNNGERTIRLENTHCRLDVRMTGDVVYTADFRGVASVARGGTFRLEESGRGESRRVTITGGSGAPEVQYQVGRATRPFDAAAEAWLAQRLLLLYRANGLAAAERSAWMLRTAGLDAVLTEAALVRSSSGRTHYLQAALAHPSMDDRRLVRLIHDGLPSSSSAQGEILTTLAARRPLSPEVGEALVEAAGRLSSSSRRRDLLVALSSADAPRAVAVAALRSARGISSSSSRAEVLVHVANTRTFDDALIDAWLHAAGGLSSSTALRESLGALVMRPELNGAQLARVLRAGGAISTSSGRADFLTGAARRPLSGEALTAYLEVARSISSSSQRARALEALH